MAGRYPGRKGLSLKRQPKNTSTRRRDAITKRRNKKLNEASFDLVFGEVRTRFQRDVTNHANLASWMSILKPEVAARSFALVYRNYVVTAVGELADLLTQYQLAKEKRITQEFKQWLSMIYPFIVAYFCAWDEAKFHLGRAIGRLFLGESEGNSAARTAFEKELKGCIVSCSDEGKRKFALRCAIQNIELKAKPGKGKAQLEKLGNKISTLKKYFPLSIFTKRQADCAVLAWGAGLPAPEIGMRLGIHRRTVQGTLEDVEKKIAKNPNMLEQIRSLRKL